MKSHDPLRALIVDDETLARDNIRMLLAEEPGVEVVEECMDGREAVAAIEEKQPDLVFLDVQMPELDGFGVVQELGPERMPAVIFVTAYDRFALQAFEASALDYLLKPYDEARFRSALHRAREAIQQQREDEFEERLRILVGELRPKQGYLERLVIRSGSRIVFVRAAEIDWLEAEGNYVRIHVGAKTHMLRETMASLEARLDPTRFRRIHRSTIINVERLRELETGFQGEYVVILQDGTRLPSGRGYRDRLRDILEPRS